MLVLLALCALCFAGYLYTRNYLSARAKQNEEDVLKINAGRTQEYNAAMAEHQQQSAADKDMQWPAAAASGWDVVDLTAYPVSEGSLTTVTRKEMLEGGLLLINRWHMMPADLTDDMMVSISRTSRADEDKNNNIPTTNSSLMLQPVAVNALMKLYGDARAAGLDMDGIIVSEGYRTMEQQTSLWNKKVESLSGDRYEWDEKGYRLVGRFTGLQYRLGDEVKVRAVSADMETSRIEFELIEEKPHKAPRESAKRSGHGSTRGRNSDKIKALKSKKGGRGFGHSKRHQKGRGKSKGTP